jgi:hypothetical protein
VFEGISREVRHGGQQTEWVRPSLNWQHHLIGWRHRWNESRRKKSTSTGQVSSSWAGGSIATAITDRHQTPASLAFQCGFTPATFQRNIRASASTETASLVFLVLRLPVSWTEQLSGPLGLHCTKGHCSRTIQPLMVWANPINLHIYISVGSFWFCSSGEAILPNSFRFLADFHTAV